MIPHEARFHPYETEPWSYQLLSARFSAVGTGAGRGKAGALALSWASRYDVGQGACAVLVPFPVNTR